MGKISHKPPTSVTPATTTSVGKSDKVSALLKQSYENTSHFMKKKGDRFLGAGRTHAFSDHPPQNEAKRVLQAVRGPLLPSKKTKR
jgi:hypothetical protein